MNKRQRKKRDKHRHNVEFIDRHVQVCKKLSFFWMDEVNVPTVQFHKLTKG